MSDEQSNLYRISDAKEDARISKQRTESEVKTCAPQTLNSSTAKSNSLPQHSQSEPSTSEKIKSASKAAGEVPSSPALNPSHESLARETYHKGYNSGNWFTHILSALETATSSAREEVRAAHITYVNQLRKNLGIVVGESLTESSLRIREERDSARQEVELRTRAFVEAEESWLKQTTLLRQEVERLKGELAQKQPCEICCREHSSSKRIQQMVHYGFTRCVQCGMRLCREHANEHFRENDASKFLHCGELAARQSEKEAMHVERDTARQEVERLKGEIAKTERNYEERADFALTLKSLLSDLGKDLARLTRIAGAWTEDNLPPSPEEVSEIVKSNIRLERNIVTLNEEWRKDLKELAELRAQLSECERGDAMLLEMVGGQTIAEGITRITKELAGAVEELAQRKEMDGEAGALIETARYERDELRALLVALQSDHSKLAAQNDSLRAALEFVLSEVPKLPGSETFGTWHLERKNAILAEVNKALAAAPAASLRERDLAVSEQSGELAIRFALRHFSNTQQDAVISAWKDETRRSLTE